MNVLLWVIQGLLAFHTGVGAVWKFSNPEQTVASLSVIPHGIWLALAVVELVCAVGLVIPAVSKRLALAVPIAAAIIAGEMLLFAELDVSSGSPTYGQVGYWLVVAAVCALLIYGRLVARPLAGTD